MSKVKVLSFTAHPDRGWSAVTPAGIFIAEPGQQVTVVCSETWEQAADAVRAMRTEREDSLALPRKPTERDNDPR